MSTHYKLFSCRQLIHYSGTQCKQILKDLFAYLTHLTLARHLANPPTPAPDATNHFSMVHHLTLDLMPPSPTPLPPLPLCMLWISMVSNKAEAPPLLMVTSWCPLTMTSHIYCIYNMKKYIIHSCNRRAGKTSCFLTRPQCLHGFVDVQCVLSLVYNQNGNVCLKIWSIALGFIWHNSDFASKFHHFMLGPIL